VEGDDNVAAENAPLGRVMTKSNEEMARIMLARSTDPRKYFGPLREKNHVDFDEDPTGAVMLLSRADIEKVLRDTDTWSNATPIMGSAEPVIPVGTDPPLHAEYRRLLDPAFSPRKMALLEPSVVEHTNRIIDRFIDRGSCDFSQELSIELPCMTFVDLFGLPRADLPRLMYWKDVMVRPNVIAGNWEDGVTLQQRESVVIYEYLDGIVAERRANPGEDVISRLAEAEIDGGRKLSDNEIVRCCFQLIAAGLDTVTVSLQSIMTYLVEHPEARELLVAEPTILDNLVEELLRWESPVQATVPRLAKVDTEVGGCPIKAGTTVMPIVAAANLDPADPGALTVDLRRGDKRHLAFGGGPHRCLGSHLARMELRVVVREWHRRIPEYRLKSGTNIVWNSSMLRGVDHLELEWDAPGRPS
jgi:cytochrome P450